MVVCECALAALTAEMTEKCIRVLKIVDLVLKRRNVPEKMMKKADLLGLK